MSKNLIFKNLLGLKLPVRHPLYKNLFSLKFGNRFLMSKIDGSSLEAIRSLITPVTMLMLLLKL